MAGTFGASIQAALMRAAIEQHWAGGQVVTTDAVLRALLACQADDVRKLLEVAGELGTPVSYGMRHSAQDGPPPAQDHPEVEATLREAGWHAGRLPRGTSGRIEWSDGVRGVLGRALGHAARGGVTRAAAAHLVLAMLTEPGCRAVRMFPATGDRIAGRLAADPLLAEDALPHPRPDDLIARAGRDRRRTWSAGLVRRMERIGRYNPLWVEVEWARRRNAVRLGHGIVTVAHTVVALVDIEERVRLYDVRLPARDAAANTAGARLAEAGATLEGLLGHARVAGDDAELADLAAVEERMRERRWNDPLWSREVVAAERRAEGIALDAHHPCTGTTHLLAALLETAPAQTSAALDAVGALGVPGLIAADLERIGAAW
ncbi:hypothetical protein [Dactylosporangium salmoneum]|uniref:Clp R domain-containing protein n=1 Tax=Dactylosporangium salmoneum TaxID=53361 RepID=A0ABN3I727_9ACTN